MRTFRHNLRKVGYIKVAMRDKNIVFTLVKYTQQRNLLNTKVNYNVPETYNARMLKENSACVYDNNN